MPFATIEKKYQGTRLFKEEGRQRAWTWKEAAATLVPTDEKRRIEFEELILLSNFFHLVDERGSQHVLVCDPNGVAPATGRCQKSYLMIHDLGAAFGDRSLKAVSGAATKNHPRGDYNAYRKTRIFSKQASCEPSLKAGGYGEISEAARRSFTDRLRFLTPELLSAAISASHFEFVDLGLRASVSAAERVQGEDLDERVRRLWFEALNEKLNEIKSARCQTISHGT
ncbi:MAG: hypothetical protein ABL958_12190 [Bdellovibrionia bacterium]